MRIGVPKEIKSHEYRLALVPSSMAELVHPGHEVLVALGAGLGAGLPDREYNAVGATIVDGPDKTSEGAGMIAKVKEPLAEERRRLRPGEVLFTYLHLAPDLAQTGNLMKSGAICIAYETVRSPSGALPLLIPTSEVDGREIAVKGERRRANWASRIAS